MRGQTRGTLADQHSCHNINKHVNAQFSYFKYHFKKGKILQSGRGVNWLLITILRFGPSSLTASMKMVTGGPF